MTNSELDEIQEETTSMEEKLEALENQIQPSLQEHQKRMAEKRVDEIISTVAIVLIILAVLYFSIHLIFYLV